MCYQSLVDTKVKIWIKKTEDSKNIAFWYVTPYNVVDDY
jgi:hypothetical protein